MPIPNFYDALDMPRHRQPTPAERERHAYDVLYEPRLQGWLQDAKVKGVPVHQDTHDLLQMHWPDNKGITFVVVPKADVPMVRDRYNLSQLEARYPSLSMSLSEAIRE